MSGIPVGYLTLLESYLVFCEVRCRPAGSQPSRQEDGSAWQRENWRLADAAADEFQRALETQKIEAVVYGKEQDRFFRITPDDIRNTKFFGRLFFSEKICALPDEPLRRHEGQVSLIEEAAFSRWFEESTGETWRRNKPVHGSSHNDALTHSGFVGRPTTKRLVQCEFDRRAALGALKGTVREEAEDLHRWLAVNHPDLPQGTAKTIRNNIGTPFRHAKAASPK